MEETHEDTIEKYNLRARMPSVIRAAAVAVLALVVLIVGIGFYFGSFRKEFRMKGLPAILSENVVAVVEGYERKETEGSRLKYSISADKATTFDDKHQELENVILEVFDEGNEQRFDKLQAKKAIYVPDPSSVDGFKIFFAGNVVIDTRDQLKIRTDQLSYYKSTETAEAEEYVEFSRENVSGNSIGATVNVRAKTLRLLKDVNIFSAPADPKSEFASKDVRTAEIRSGAAFVDQEAGTIELKGGVVAVLVPNPGNPNFERPTTITSPKATAFIEEKQLRRLELSGGAKLAQEPGGTGRYTNASADLISAEVVKEIERLEMRGNVSIQTAADKAAPAEITSKTAVYERAGDKFDLDGGVEIRSTNSGKRSIARSESAVYRQSLGEVTLNGNASVEQGTDSVGGDVIKALLYKDKSLKNADVRGNAFFRQSSAERKGELRAPELHARFARGGSAELASASGASSVEVVPLGNPDYSKYSLRSPKGIEMRFGNDGKPAAALTEGRTTIVLTATGSGPNASDKTLTADEVRTGFKGGTSELSSASAIGNAVLVIIPKESTAGAYRTEVRSPRFDCDFYSGNNAKSCTGKGRGEARRIPQGNNGRGEQILASDQFVASFDRVTKDISTLAASGNSKFREQNRNGMSEDITYSAADNTVRLRGGEPTIWDETGRVKAEEIDWNLKADSSAYRGKVSATYYSQRKARGATPFAKVNSPVFVSSNLAQFDHKQESAVFLGNARAWQDKNYVRADRILLEQQTSRFYAEGAVQSLLYDAKRTAGGKRSSVPVYAQADSMLYLNGDRTLRYTGNVDIRQGTDRIRAGTAAVFLDESNELKQTVAEKDVVITQPGRKATGDYAKYDVSEEVIVLRGSPATLRDEQRGSSEGREVVVRLKDNSVIGTGKSGDDGTGRMRSVYKLKDGKLN